MTRQVEHEELLTASEVASLFRVNIRTVARWVDAGKLTCTRTPGNHRRFSAAEVRALLKGGQR